MNQEKKKFNIIENITFLVGILVLTALVGYLGYQLTQKNGYPPHLIVTNKYDSSLPYHAYKIQVQNQGQKTAETVQINFDLFQDGKQVETASTNINYIPVNSKKIGWIVFTTKKTSNDSLVVSSMTFLEP